jgi:5-methylcytosine-specific restriction endonuclease McrA
MPYASVEQQRTYQREWARQRRARLLGPGACCMRCGATERLELHHLVKDEKVSHRITTWAPARAQAEAAKCWVLCSRCHRNLHTDEVRAKCGTESSYNAGCRCDDCRLAHRAAAREYRSRISV